MAKDLDDIIAKTASMKKPGKKAPAKAKVKARPRKNCKSAKRAAPLIEPPRPEGRPHGYTQEKADQISELLAAGNSMRTVCSIAGMPAMSTVFKWLREIPEFSEQYARAKAEAADTLVDEMLDIVDNEVEQPLMVDGLPMQVDGKIVMIKDAVSVNHARLRADVRKWIASKLKPKAYGDKLELGSDPDKPLITVTRVELVPLGRNSPN